MPDPSQVFARILETLGVDNAPKVAKKLGLTKQSVYEWEKKLPSLENLIKIAESGNTSLDYLLTGKSSSPQSEVDAALDERIRYILRQELGYMKEESGDLKLIIRKMVKSSAGAPSFAVGEAKKKKTA